MAVRKSSNRLNVFASGELLIYGELAFKKFICIYNRIRSRIERDNFLAIALKCRLSLFRNYIWKDYQCAIVLGGRKTRDRGSSKLETSVGVLKLKDADFFNLAKIFHFLSLRFAEAFTDVGQQIRVVCPWNSFIIVHGNLAVDHVPAATGNDASVPLDCDCVLIWLVV